MTAVGLQVEGLRVVYDGFVAVDGASFSVQPGESFGIVLAEALASGTPVIGAANAGYRTVLTGPGASLLVPARPVEFQRGAGCGVDIASFRASDQGCEVGCVGRCHTPF